MAVEDGVRGTIYIYVVDVVVVVVVFYIYRKEKKKKRQGICKVLCNCLFLLL